jgi:uncharacterized protein (TIGR00255 family)
MTGFARSDTQSPAGRLLWELRSVNHRYLEVQLRLPEAFRAIEAEARQVIAAGIRRGKVDATLSLRTEGAARPAQGALNLGFALELLGHAGALAGKIGNAAPINPVDILRWPGVLQEPETRHEALFPLALEALGRAVGEIGESREREGARLRELLESRCAEILTRIDTVEQRVPEVLAAIREKLAERVRSLVATLDPQRLEQEIVIVAQKLDVSEELDRLRSHVIEFRAAMSKGEEAAGRRLDFLLQEFNREANTLASKSADSDTTREAVELKVLIEQMREQVQNVE